MSRDAPEATARIGRRAVLLGPLLLAACGFVPAHAPRGPGDRLRGRVAVVATDTPDGFRLRAALEDRLGPPGPGAARLILAPAVEERLTGMLPDGSSARGALDGRVDWQLGSASGAVLARGEERAFTGVSVTGPAVSVRGARADARERLMALLADRILARLLMLPPEALP